MTLCSPWQQGLVVTALYVLIGNALSEYTLTILHTNDIHARIQEIDKYLGGCSEKESKNQECFGGYARIKTKVDEIRSRDKNTILVDGGDQYMGTLWFYLYGGNVMSNFMNLIGYDAMGLGNHEFDDGPDGLKPFLDNATFPVLSCNIDTAKTPQLKSVQKSTILEIGGQKIGIVGYTTADTPLISNPGKVDFSDEIEAIKAEVEALTSSCEEVNKIIAVGHAGYGKDIEIAKKVVGIDVVVGGHSNTFLYTGNQPNSEAPKGLYPTNITNVNGDTVLVVQDFAYGKYLGNLKVTFDDQGKVTSWKGNPILLDHSVQKNRQVLDLMQHYLPDMAKRRNEKIGRSFVFLQGDRSVCRFTECNLGNLITDAMVHENLRVSDGLEWSKQVVIAVVNAGGIRANINPGHVSIADVLKVLPFSNSVDIVQIRGQTIKDLLEHSASHRDGEGKGQEFDGFGGFLQVAGLRVVYDQNKRNGEKVVSLKALCTDCKVPKFEPINLTQKYMVLMQDYLIKGKTGFSLEGKILLRHTIGNKDATILTNYIHKRDPVYQGLDGRIRVIEKKP